MRPQTKAKGSVDRFLEQSLLLPRDENRLPAEFRAVPTESITVVLFRSEMSLTDISEVRQVLRLWGRAREREGREDHLQWRQRTGYRDSWLASTESDRQRVLQRMLCAMWNGRVEVNGDPLSPDSVCFRLRSGDSATMTLALEPYDQDVSSWSDLLRAYERWALLDAGSAVKDFCSVLMEALPDGLSTTPRDPDPLFWTFLRKVAPQQAARLRQRARDLDADDQEWIEPLLHFWTTTLEGALKLRFPRGLRANRPSLHALAQARSPKDGGTPPRLHQVNGHEPAGEDRARETRPYGTDPYGADPYETDPSENGRYGPERHTKERHANERHTNERHTPDPYEPPPRRKTGPHERRPEAEGTARPAGRDDDDLWADPWDEEPREEDLL
ncbi:Tubulin-like protein OS=Streptomyces rimosus subsp. rimosus (strain ATCC / DSM 40260 / JCM 4667/ NRRL 2234) OX=1265868 GN=SRIM_031605 PE=4 SV=1 [Streptomyces rimosus subsp. rimosus]